MSRRNMHLLMLILIVSLVCYHKADGVHRTRYGGMAETFVTALGDIHDRYLYPIDDRKLFEAAMEGLVSKLDPYSGYDGEEKTRRFRESIGQEFGGIGVEVNWDRETNSLIVFSPMFGTPAFEKGLQPGDRILKIDDVSTDKIDLVKAVSMIQGKPGEIVRLTIVREGEATPRVIELRRAVIKVNSVLGDRRLPDGTWSYVLAEAPDIGYIRITQFGEKTADELPKALQQLRAEHVRGLILDLRNNPGGLLESAIEVCDQFVSQGTIVKTKDRNGIVTKLYEATGKAQYVDWPIAVLVNGSSASAAEIVAACLQDHDRAVIIGERTFGKGTVQSPIDLEGGKSMLRLTIAGFWRPSDRNIHRTEDAKETDVWGVSPSLGYEVKLDDQRIVDLAQQRRRRDVLPLPADVKPPTVRRPTRAEPEDGSVDVADPSDPVLEKALEYLRAKISESGPMKKAG